MIKKYEVEAIIRNALEELDGMLSPPNYNNGKSTVYESVVTEDENGDLIFIFKEDCFSDDTDKYRIKVTYEQI